LALVIAALGGCAQLRELFVPQAPGVADEWAALLDEVRAFEHRIGFGETDNFFDLSQEQHAFPFCGYASSLQLPYSYEDPAIRWLDSVTERECREIGAKADVYYGASEALGEVGTPVTPAMITSRLDRFLYLVIHEDCHDQFELPYGIEEPLCDLIAFKAMAVFSEEKFGSFAREERAVRRYADRQSKLARTTIRFYDQLAALYARHGRAEISSEALLRERGAILKTAERVLGSPQGELNNVALANDMTYSRHYPVLESVFDSLGRDLARTVAFFREVDKRKPSRAQVRKTQRIADEESVDFIRLYEQAVLETTRQLLTEPGWRRPAPDAWFPADLPGARAGPVPAEQAGQGAGAAASGGGRVIPLK
jgi:hypothetical protein